jgi:hypothetical protein
VVALHAHFHRILGHNFQVLRGDRVADLNGSLQVIDQYRKPLLYGSPRRLAIWRRKCIELLFDFGINSLDEWRMRANQYRARLHVVLRLSKHVSSNGGRIA